MVTESISRRGRPKKLSSPRLVEKIMWSRDALIAQFAVKHGTAAAAKKFGKTPRRVQQIRADVRVAAKLYKPIEKRMYRDMRLKRAYAPVISKLLDLVPKLGLQESEFEKVPVSAWIVMLRLHRTMLTQHRRCVAAEKRAAKAESELKSRKTREAARTAWPAYNQERNEIAARR